MRFWFSVSQILIDKVAYGWIYVHFGFSFKNETPCINSSVHPNVTDFAIYVAGVPRVCYNAIA